MNREQKLQLMNKFKQENKSLSEALGAVNAVRNGRATFESFIQSEKPSDLVNQAEGGLLSDLGNDIKETGAGIASSIRRSADRFTETAEADQGFFSTVTQGAGNALGAVGGVIMEGAKGLGKAILPQSAEDAISNTVDSAVESVMSNETIAEALQTSMEEYADFKAERPELARNIEAILSGVEGVATLASAGATGTVLKAGKDAIQKASKEGLKHAAIQGSKLIASTADARGSLSELQQKTLDRIRNLKPQMFQANSVVDIVRDTPSKAEKVRRISSGGVDAVSESGFFRTLDINPTKRDMAIAEAVGDVIDVKKPLAENISSISTEIGRLADDLEIGIKSNNAPFNNNQLISRLSQAKESNRVIFGTDATLESAYDAIIAEFRTHLKSNNNLGLLEARKAFDIVAREKFPRTFDGNVSDNIRKNAILDVRREVNDFLADNVESVDVKNSLRNQSMMFEARDNMAEKVARELGKTALERNEIYQSLRDYRGVIGTMAAVGVTGAAF